MHVGLEAALMWTVPPSPCIVAWKDHREIPVRPDAAFVVDG
jgi:hypothetical protein